MIWVLVILNIIGWGIAVAEFVMLVLATVGFAAMTEDSQMQKRAINSNFHSRKWKND